MVATRGLLHSASVQLSMIWGVTATLLASGCSSEPPAAPTVVHAAVSAGTASGGSAATVEFLIPAVPNASCTISAGNLAGNLARSVDSDGVGLIHLYRPDTAAAVPSGISLTVNCTAQDGSQTENQIDSGTLETSQAALKATLSMSSPGQPRPRLFGDLTAYRQEDLIAMGYPPRPDPVQAPAAYATWVQRASRQVAIRPQHPIAHAERQRPTPTQFFDIQHSGMQLFAPAGKKYMDISAEWSVPSIVLQHLSGYITSSMWVGLDGVFGTGGAAHVAQGGTDSDEENFGFFGDWAIYYAWTQFWHGPFHSQPSIPVSPGDQFFVEEWIGDVNGNATTSGTYGWTYIDNLTQSVANSFKEPIPPGQTYVGDSSWWTLERGTTTINGHDVIDSLAKYTVATMTNTEAFDAGWSFHDWTTDAAWLMFMRNPPGSPTGHLLTQVTVSPSTLSYSWGAPN